MTIPDRYAIPAPLPADEDLDQAHAPFEDEGE